MGLDIYAGTLTRYYSHNWKTIVQQWAEENGYTFNRITPDGEPADNEEELSQSFSTVGGTGSSYVWQAATSSMAPNASQSGLSV